jgi:hypothetical protein
MGTILATFESLEIMFNNLFVDEVDEKTWERWVEVLEECGWTEEMWITKLEDQLRRGLESKRQL